MPTPQRKPMRPILSALAFALLVSGSLCLPAPASAAGPATIPAFSLPDLEGKTHGPEEWKGKVVVVHFWATWCVACGETITVVRRLTAKYGDKGLVGRGVTL